MSSAEFRSTSDPLKEAGILGLDLASIGLAFKAFLEILAGSPLLSLNVLGPAALGLGTLFAANHLKNTA